MVSPFNPVYFLYLNPGLCLASNIATIADARDYWAANSNAPVPTWCNLDYIPDALDPATFLGENLGSVDISSLNEQIRLTMLQQGYSSNDLLSMSTFAVPTIYRAIYPAVGLSNAFRFNNPGDKNLVFISESNLRIGDDVKIVQDSGPPIITRVTDIIDRQTFAVGAEGAGLCVSPSTNYLLTGIRLYDPLRLARINFLSLYRATGSQIDLVNVEPDFNYELYSMLYPNSRNMTKEGAFVDYINRLGNNDFRVARVEDLVEGAGGGGGGGGMGGFGPDYEKVESLTVGHVLNLNFGSQQTGRFVWNGVTMYYVTKDPFRPLSVVSPFFQGLITEYAIKMYINNLLFPNFTISNLNVSGDAAFRGNTTMSNLVVTGQMQLTNDLVGQDAAFSNVTVSRALDVGGYIGIGIGSEPGAEHAYFVPSSNLQAANVYVDETMYVGGPTQFAGEVLGQGAVFSEAVQGGRFAIGAGPGFSADSEGTNIVNNLVVSSNIRAAAANMGWATMGNATVCNAISAFSATSTNLQAAVGVFTSNLVSEGATNLLGPVNMTQLSAADLLAQNLAASNGAMQSLAASNATLGGLQADNAAVTNLEAYYVSTTNIDASEARVESLAASNLDIRGNLNFEGELMYKGASYKSPTFATIRFSSNQSIETDGQILDLDYSGLGSGEISLGPAATGKEIVENLCLLNDGASIYNNTGKDALVSLFISGALSDRHVCIILDNGAHVVLQNGVLTTVLIGDGSSCRFGLFLNSGSFVPMTLNSCKLAVACFQVL